MVFRWTRLYLSDLRGDRGLPCVLEKRWVVIESHRFAAGSEIAAAYFRLYCVHQRLQHIQ